MNFIQSSKKKYFLISFLVLFFGCSSSDDEQILASGTIETTEVTINAKVGGQVLKLFVDEGSDVKMGDTLAIIDRSDLEIQLEQAKANLHAEEAQYKLIVQGTREEDVAQAEATLKNAEDDLYRSERLFNEKCISQKQLEDARTRYILAKQNYDKLKRGFRPEEVEVVRARRDQAAAQVKAIKKKIEDSFVKAPIVGVVTLKVIEEGEVIMPNASLFRISQLDIVHLMIYISEEELARVKLGQPANVYIDAFPKKPFSGKIIYISSVAEFTPKNVQTKEDRTKLVFGVKIEIPNPERILKPGMPADAVISVAQN